MSDVETFMSARGLSPHLCNKIRDYYKLRYPSKKVWDEEEIIKDIESPFLKKDIVEHLFRDVVKTCPFLKVVCVFVCVRVCVCACVAQGRAARELRMFRCILVNGIIEC